MGNGCGKEAGAVVAPPAPKVADADPKATVATPQTAEAPPMHQKGEPPIVQPSSNDGPTKAVDGPAANGAGGSDLQSFCDEFQKAVDERQLSATANTVLDVASSMLSKIVALDLPFPLGPLCNLASGVVGLALNLSKNFEEARQLAERIARVHFTVIDVAQRGHLEAHARAFGAILTNCRAVLEEFKLTSTANEPTFLERVMGVAHSVSAETSAKIAKLHVGLNELSLDTALSEVLKVVPAMEHMHRQVMDTLLDLGGSLDKLAAEAASANNVVENVRVVRVVVQVRMQERIGDVSVPLQGSKVPTLALPAPMEDLVQTWVSTKVLSPPSGPAKGGRPVRRQPQVLVVEGGGGSGKSHFVHGLVQRAWDAAPTDADGVPPMPMFMIPMQSVTDPNAMVATALRRAGVGAALEQLLKKRAVLFVLDALDEWPLRRLLFTQTDLQDWPNAHVLATTRPEFIETWGVGMLMPSTDGGPRVASSIGPQRLHCVPFGRGDIERYVDAIAESMGMAAADVQRVNDVIASNHGLITLCANPFVLSRVVSILAVDTLEAEVTRWTRREVYRRWLAMHWRHETTRLQGKPHTDLPHLPAVLEALQQALVMQVLHARAADPPRDPSLAAAVADVAGLAALPPKERFVCDDIVRSMPLRIDGDRYVFVHETVLEFLTSDLPVPEVMAHVAAKPFSGSDQSLIGFLAERVAEEPPCAADMWRRLQGSAADSDLDDVHWLRKALWAALQPSSQWPATANALTVLVVANRRVVRDACFDGLNLEGAILDGAIFQRCTFRSCNLRNVAYHNVRTFDCSFAACNFEGASFERLPMRGHESAVNVVVFSPDGSTLASCSDDTTVRLWSASTGSPLHVLQGHKRAVNAVVCSPDGNTLASCSDDMTVRVWDASTGSPLHVLEGYNHAANAVVFSPDGSTLASCNMYREVRVWNTSTGAPLHVLQGNMHACTLGVGSVCFSPDGSVIAACSWTVSIWDAATGALLHELEGRGIMKSVCFSPDGRAIASCSDDSTLRLWDANSGDLLHVLQGHGSSVNHVCFSPDGRAIASCSNDSTLRLWDANSGDVLHVLQGHGSSVNHVCFSPDGRTIASCSGDRTLRLWDANSGTSLSVLEGHHSSVSLLNFSPDGKTVVTCSYDKTVRVWDVLSRTSMHALEGFRGGLSCKCFSPDDRTIATSGDATVRIWDASTGAPLHLLEGHTDHVTSVCFSPDGSILASSSIDETVRIWDASCGVSLHVLRGSKYKVLAVCFSPDGSFLASSGYGPVRLWDVSTGALLHALNGHNGFVNVVCFSADGRTIASGSDDETIRLWDAASGASLRVLKHFVCDDADDDEYDRDEDREHHSETMDAVCFSPDGATIAACTTRTTVRVCDEKTLGVDAIVRLWDVNSGVVRHVLKGHRAPVWYLRFSHDGSTIASFGRDSTLRVWEAATGQALRTMPFEHAEGNRITFSHDGSRVASGSDDLAVWAVEGTDVSLLWVAAGQRLGKHVCLGPAGTPDDRCPMKCGV